MDQAQARATTAAAHEEEAGECAARAAREAQALRARLDRERGVWEEERNRIVAALTQAQAEAAAAQQDAANAKVRSWTLQLPKYHWMNIKYRVYVLI